MHTNITCIKSTGTEYHDHQTQSPPIEVNPKNEIFIDEPQHFDEPPIIMQPSPENQTIEEITVDPSTSIKIEPICFDSECRVQSAEVPVQQNDDGKTSTPAPISSTRVQTTERNRNRSRWANEFIECPIDGCGRTIKRCYKSKHIKEKHGAGFKCSTCDSRFLTTGTLEQHAKQCVVSEKFKCEFCFASYTIKKSLTIHKFENHKSEREQRKETNTKKRKAQKVKYLNKMVKCEFNGCDLMMRKMQMWKHMKDDHGSGENCPKCNKVFLSKEKLEMHKRMHAAGAIHDENQIFTCDICNISITTKQLLITHMRHHIPENLRIECTICNRRFIDKTGLRNHMRYHGESQWVCSICGQEYKLKAHLADHERIHTGERPFKCGFDCGKMFRTSSLKCQHERIHTGAKPFKCAQPNCSRAYAFDIDLKRHLFAVHSIWTKKHPCPHATCENKVFPEQKLLRKHLKTVHGIEG